MPSSPPIRRGPSRSSTRSPPRSAGCRRARPSGGRSGRSFASSTSGTRLPVESPVEQVARHGRDDGLANHTVLLAADGRETPIDDSAAPIIDGDQLSGVVLVFRDVTEKRRAAELNERLAAIVESSDDIIASKDLDGVITSWNKGAERILGYTAEEVIGKHVSMLMPPELIEDMPRILERIRRGEKVDHYHTRRRRKDGTIIDVSLTVSPIRDASGRDHRGLEDRPRHHRREAGPRGARAAPGGRPEGEGRRRGRQSPEGRVPRHALARAADPAQRHPRLGEDPAHRPGGCPRTSRRASPPSTATPGCRPRSSRTCSTSPASSRATSGSTSSGSTCRRSSRRPSPP